MIRRYGYTLSILWFSLVTAAWGHPPPDWRVWKVMDGLAESFSHDVFLDAQGHVWVNQGDVSRISRLDGYRVTLFPNPVPQAPVSVNPQGQIWSLYPGGLQIFEGNEWIKYPVDEVDVPVPFLSPARNEVLFLLPDYLVGFDAQTKQTRILKAAAETGLGRFNDLLRARDGSLWLAGAAGCARIQPDGGPVTPQSPYREFHVDTPGTRDFHALAEGTNGELFAVARGPDSSTVVLARWDGSGWNILRAGSTPVRKCWRGPGGQIWMWLANGSIRVIQANGEIHAPEDEIFERVYGIEPEPTGGFWMATPQGLVRYASPLWETPAPVAAIRDTVSCIQEDSQGRLWFAAGSRLILLDQDTWKTFSLPPGHRFPSYQSQTLAPLGDGRIALHTLSENPRLPLFNPDTAQYEFVSHPGGGWIRPSGPRTAGSVWIRHGTGEEDDGFRLEIFDGREFRVFLDPGQPWNIGSFRSLMETSRGDLWIGGSNGLGCYQDGQYRNINAEDGFSGTGAFCLHER
ncbi:MAG TPA: two-component regulator propeller domain-containing protein, partial [bacterium]|nr:two-component regulator propeller domain-containing protein [bacterium]